MSEPFIGEIRMVGFNFAPVDWALCNGAVVAISDYAPLFNLIGTTYGGNGTTNFALPNLQSRMPVHQGTLNTGTSYAIGEIGGIENVTLTTPQIPVHIHSLNAVSAPGNASVPGNSSGQGLAVWAESSLNEYSTGSPTLTMHTNALGSAGGSQPHSNLPPYVTINFIIALFGIYPRQS